MSSSCQAVNVHEQTTLTSPAAVVYLQGISYPLHGVYQEHYTGTPYISVDPNNAKRMIYSCLDGNYTGSGEAAAVFYTSIDGGKCWQLANVGFTLAQAPGTTYELVATPHSWFGTDGTMFLTTVAYDTASDYNEAILVSKSCDDGLTWSAPIVATSDNGENDDLDYVVGYADASRPGTQYLMYTDYYQNNQYNQLYIQISTDNGDTWSIRIPVTSQPLTINTWGASLVFLPSSQNSSKHCNSHAMPYNLLAVFDVTNLDTGAGNIQGFLSVDGGMTWTAQALGPATPNPIVGSVPIPGIPTSQFYFSYGEPSAMSVVTDSKKKRIYAVANSSQYSAAGQVGLVMVQTSDGGTTWSNPIPATNPKYLQPYSQVHGAIAVLKNHIVGVMYADFRFYGMKDPSLGQTNQDAWTNVWIALFDKRLKKFIGEIRVTEQSFDIRQLYGEYSHGVFDELNFGSYFQLTAVDNTFYVAWQETVEPYGSYPARYMDSSVLETNNQFIVDHRPRVRCMFKAIPFRKRYLSDKC